MDYFNLSSYFPISLKNNHFILEKIRYPWEIVSKIKPAISLFFANQSTNSYSLPQGITRNITKLEATNSIIVNYFFTQDILFKIPFIDKEHSLFIGANTFIEAGATIKNNVVIQENCLIRQAAYIREDCWISEHCTVGHATELKHCFFFTHVESGHFAYVGDSVVGAYTNLGAGTKVSNLVFRTLEQKQSNQLSQVHLTTEPGSYKLPFNKLGAIIGEGFESGCNSVLSPVTLIGYETQVFPAICVPKGIYPPKSRLIDLETTKRSKLS